MNKLIVKTRLEPFKNKKKDLHIILFQFFCLFTQINIMLFLYQTNKKNLENNKSYPLLFFSCCQNSLKLDSNSTFS